jgi:glycogen synthase
MAAMIRIGLVLLHRNSLGTIVRVRELANSLARTGFEIYIISPFDIREMGFHGVHSTRVVGSLGKLIYSPIGSSLRKTLLRPRSQTGLPLNTELIRRGIDFLGKNIAKIADRLQLDILEGEQDIAAAAVVKASGSVGIPAVAGLHNIWREELLGQRGLPRQTDEFLRGLLTWTLDKADLITVVSGAMKTQLISDYQGRPKQIQVVPLGCRPKRTNVPYPDEGPPNVVHSGQISFYDNEDLLLRTAIEFKKRSDGPFYIARKGDGARLFEGRARRLGASLDWYWYPNPDDFYDFLRKCSLGVVTSLDHPTRHYGPSMKFYDYLSCGLPVVANDIGGWTDEIKQYGVGYLADSDPVSMAEAIISLASDREKAYVAAQRALTLAHTTFNIDFITEQLALRYAALVS